VFDSGNNASPASSGDVFTYTPGVPTVSSVSPSSGPQTGGTSITITGTGFANGDTVKIAQGNGAYTGSLAATSVVVVNSTTITATTPGGALVGALHIFVIDSGNNASASNNGDVFTYT